MHNYIIGFQPHNTHRLIDQKRAIDWLVQYHGKENEEKFRKYAVKEDYINSRVSYAKGTIKSDELPYLFEQGESISPSINKRANAAQLVCEEIFEDLYRDENVRPDHINHVSCSHYQSPSAAQKLVVGKEWFSETKVTHLYHMGCYAAMPAVRVSKSYLADGAKKVDVVHTELCSFHLDKAQLTADQIIMKTLFADGAIKYSVVNEELFKQSKFSGFKILGHHEVIVPNSDKEMSWELGETGFIMGLTKNVPIYLAKKIESFMKDLFLESDLDFNKHKESILFAVHPGGPKIIELVEKMLKLKDFQVSHSKDILRKRGNMSSATIPHIWQSILSDNSIDNKIVASVAFGPGLTMTGVVLEICKQS